MHAIETEAEEVLGLLRRAPPIPAGRLVGAGDGWQTRDGYEVTVLIDGTGLSQLAHRRTWHRPSMWPHPDLRQAGLRAREGDPSAGAIIAIFGTHRRLGPIFPERGYASRAACSLRSPRESSSRRRSRSRSRATSRPSVPVEDCLDADPQQDAHRLHLKREAKRVETL